MRILLASRNQHKASEIQALLPASCQLVTLKGFPDAPVAIEDAETFAGNAAKKALELARWLASRATDESTPPGGNEPWSVLADDSGLEVDALQGAPGVKSARFAALDSGATANSSDAENNAKLLRLLEHVPPDRRTARFRCVLALVLCPPKLASSDLAKMAVELFEGKCEGRIGFVPQGQHGFGYDPLFIPEGFQETFAELGEDAKNRISHRAQALRELSGWLAHRKSPE